MKTANITKIINKYIKLNSFKKIKLLECEKIDKIFDESISVSNKLSKDLNNFSSLDSSIINDVNTHQNNKIKNKFNKFIRNKILLKKKKFMSSKRYINNKKQLISFSEKKWHKDNYNNKSKKYNSSYFSKLADINLKDSDKKFSFNYKTILNLKKRKIVSFEPKKERILNNFINISNKSNSLISKQLEKTDNLSEKSTNIEHNNDYNNYKNKTFILKAFVTQQKLNTKKKNNSTKNIMKYKILSKDNINDLINTSSSLYNSQKITIKRNNDAFISSRRTFYNIKNLLNKFEISKSIKKEIDDSINDNIYKRMKLFHNNYKSKINNKYTSKSSIISKQNADIINYCDYLSKMDDLYFYKNNKIYNNYYPILSEKARIEPIKRNISNLHKNNIDEKMIEIIKILKSCHKIYDKINGLVTPIEKIRNKNSFCEL